MVHAITSIQTKPALNDRQAQRLHTAAMHIDMFCHALAHQKIKPCDSDKITLWFTDKKWAVFA
jgi:HD-like signal output (HDOD) protein